MNTLKPSSSGQLFIIQTRPYQDNVIFRFEWLSLCAIQGETKFQPHFLIYFIILFWDEKKIFEVWFLFFSHNKKFISNVSHYPILHSNWHDSMINKNSHSYFDEKKKRKILNKRLCNGNATHKFRKNHFYFKWKTSLYIMYMNMNHFTDYSITKRTESMKKISTHRIFHIICVAIENVFFWKFWNVFIL